MEYTGVWSGYGDSQGDMHSWTHEQDIDGGPSGISLQFEYTCCCNLNYMWIKILHLFISHLGLEDKVGVSAIQNEAGSEVNIFFYFVRYYYAAASGARWNTNNT